MNNSFSIFSSFWKLTCPIVVGATLGDIKFLNWCLTSLLNPTNSRYAPLKPHLQWKKILTYHFRTYWPNLLLAPWRTYPVSHTTNSELLHFLLETVTCNKRRLLRLCWANHYFHGCIKWRSTDGKWSRPGARFSNFRSWKPQQNLKVTITEPFHSHVLNMKFQDYALPCLWDTETVPRTLAMLLYLQLLYTAETEITPRS